MLTTLRIRNLALVADLTLELPAGFVAITGETGAGKSIIIGALNLILGERADRALIRSGEETCSVEAVFEPGSATRRIRPLLGAHGLETGDSDQLLLKRVFGATGVNRQYVNGSPTTLQSLAAIGEWLVDVHGPHDHQSLLHPSRQLAILDAFGDHARELAACADAVGRLQAIESKIASLIVDDQTYAQQLDLLRFQVREIADAQLQPGEEEEIAESYQRARNASRLVQVGQAALGMLCENETAITAQAGSISRLVQELKRLDPGSQPLVETHEQLTASIRELQNFLRRYVEKIELDPSRLASLEERLNIIQTLKRKYGNSIEHILKTGEECSQRLALLEGRQTELAHLRLEQRKTLDVLWQLSLELSAKRRRLIPRLTAAVSRELAGLGFRLSKFEIDVESAQRTDATENETETVKTGVRPSAIGIDTVEFQFAPNPGELRRPLRAIASSGEMARVMLALKTVLAAHDDIPVLVFDEVDANIGGETANEVGDKLCALAANRQVFCITHLPQVAARATSHFVVTKETRGGRTISTMRRLDGEERLTELARMLGGQSGAARRHAAALVEGGKKDRRC